MAMHPNDNNILAIASSVWTESQAKEKRKERERGERREERGERREERGERESGERRGKERKRLMFIFCRAILSMW